MKFWIVNLAIFSVWILQTGSAAADDDKKGPAADRKQMVLERFDADGDGTLNANERAKAREEFASRRRAGDSNEQRPRPERDRKLLLERFDRNQDGRLDERERADAKRAMSPQNGNPANRQNLAGLKRLIQNADTDGDGELSEQERSELQKRLMAQVPDGRGSMAAQRIQQIMKRLGPDGLSRLTDTERKNMKSGTRTRRRAGAGDSPERKAPPTNPSARRKPRISPELLERFDTDGDGELNAEERKAARKSRDAEKPSSNG